MILSKTRNMGAYLRKMSIDGYIINTDTAQIKQVYEEIHIAQSNCRSSYEIRSILFTSFVEVISSQMCILPYTYLIPSS